MLVQEHVLRKFPHPTRLTLLSFVVGSFQMVSLAAYEGRPFSLTKSEALAVAYAGVFAAAFNYTVMSWANQSVGPTMVSMFLPLQPVVGGVLAYAVLGLPVHAGVVAGGALVFVGLYAVVWGKGAGGGAAGANSSKAWAGRVCECDVAAWSLRERKTRVVAY